MSEDNTTPAEGTTEAPQAPSLGVNDLKVMANIIEVVSNRGAIRANEMAAVGNVYNILMNFLIANGAVKPAEENTAEEKTEETSEVAEKQEEVSND
tara:strand:- start:346 stop:633 length:288 start_codon:yes stop_codon:yes gene_type:complete